MKTIILLIILIVISLVDGLQNNLMLGIMCILFIPYMLPRNFEIIKKETNEKEKRNNYITVNRCNGNINKLC